MDATKNTSIKRKNNYYKYDTDILELYILMTIL